MQKEKTRLGGLVSGKSAWCLTTGFPWVDMKPSHKVRVLLIKRLKSKRKAARKRSEARKASGRSRANRRRQLLLTLAAILDSEAADSMHEKRERRKLVRAKDSWKGSTMYGYLYLQLTDDAKEKVYKDNFRMTPRTFDKLTCDISASQLAFVPRTGVVKNELKPVSFKLGVCLYVLAIGACTKATADVASMGKSTVEMWLLQFANVCMKVLKPQYMPATPMLPEHLERVRSEFAARRGISVAAMACDGSHVPFRTHHGDYRNYKGWYSILVVAFVNSFYLFVGGDVGFPGKAGDNTVLRSSWLMKQITAHRREYLGEDGVVLGDSGASDADGLFMNPYPHPKTPQEFYFNFCHSSTRFYVEETFGRWKNRFRFLLHDHDMRHKLHTLLVYSSMILHNVCTIEKDDAVDFDSGSDAGWKAFFNEYKRDRCPSCVRAQLAHCPHNKRNRKCCIPKGTPSEQRDLLAASLWEALCNGEHDLMPTHAYAGPHGTNAREYAQMQRAMEARAAAGTTHAAQAP